MTKLLMRIRDYFTANLCRKIFFLGLLLALCSYLLNLILTIRLLNFLALACLAAAISASLLDTMHARTQFLYQVRNLQYEHLQNIYERQEAGEDVAFTPTFDDDEKKYVRRKKAAYIGLIIFKTALLLALFPLLFGM